MKATQNDCIPFTGRPIKYQAAAAEAYWIETGFQPSTWTWITSTCGTDCLNPDHLEFSEPKLLGYLEHQCIYCGRSGWTKDHLLPRNWSGNAKRAYVVTVPACGTCNSILGDTLTWSITERRAICHARLRHKYRRVLAHVEFGASDLRDFGPTLRADVEAGLRKKREVEGMLAWPPTPDYDERACEAAGLVDPYAIGLLISEAEASRIAAEVVGAERGIETLAEAKDADSAARKRQRQMDAKVAALAAKMRADSKDAS